MIYALKWITNLKVKSGRLMIYYIYQMLKPQQKFKCIQDRNGLYWDLLGS